MFENLKAAISSKRLKILFNIGEDIFKDRSTHLFYGFARFTLHSKLFVVVEPAHTKYGTKGSCAQYFKNLEQIPPVMLLSKMALQLLLAVTSNNSKIFFT